MSTILVLNFTNQLLIGWYLISNVKIHLVFQRKTKKEGKKLKRREFKKEKSKKKRKEKEKDNLKKVFSVLSGYQLRVDEGMNQQVNEK